MTGVTSDVGVPSTHLFITGIGIIVIIVIIIIITIVITVIIMIALLINVVIIYVGKLLQAIKYFESQVFFDAHDSLFCYRNLSLLNMNLLVTKIIHFRAPSQYKDDLFGYGILHCKDNTVEIPSYLYNGNSFTGKTVYLYWDGPLIF